MDDSNKINKNNSRRTFVVNLVLASIGAIAGSSVLLSACKSETNKGVKGKIKVLNQNNQLVEVDASSVTPVAIDDTTDYLQKQGREGLEGKKFILVVDLKNCKNARKCMDSCQSVHQLRPEQHHLNVLQMQDNELGSTYYMPKHCQHCDNPPCVKVCPVDATFKRKDGIVLIDNERCIGCRFCIAACPYTARSFNWYEPRDAEKYKNMPYDIEKNVPQKKGTVTKCTFSADCLREGKLPYCVSACPNSTYWFGNALEDTVTNGTTGESVSLKKLLKENAGYRLMEDLGTQPSVYYLPHESITTPNQPS